MSDSTQLASSVALLGAAIALILRLRNGDQLARDTRRLTYQLNHPRGLTIEQVADFLHALSRLRPSRGWLFGRGSVVFELVGSPDRVEYRLRLPEHQADALLRQLHTAAPGIRAVLIQQPALPRPQWVRRIYLTTAARSLRTDRPDAFAGSLVSSLQPLRPGETLLYQLVVYPVRTPRVKDAEPAPPGGAFPWFAGVSQLLAGAPPPIYDKQALAAFKAKVATPWLGVVGLVGATAATKGRAHLLVGRVMASLHQLDQDGVELVPRWEPAAQAARWLSRAATRLWAAIYLNTQELATLVAWPLGAPALPGLSLTGGRALPPTSDVPAEGRVLGTASYDGMQRPVAVSPHEALHQLVIGPTGTGKSTLLLNEIVQDMRAGHGIVLIDPNGDLARDVIDRIPGNRVGDLIYLNPSNDRPVGLNPLACAPNDAELVADQVFSLVRGQAVGWGARLAELLRNSLVVLAATGMALTELPLLLTNRPFRDGLVARLPPLFAPTVGDYFARFNDWSEGDYGLTVPAVLNRVSPFIDRWRLRAILGQSAPDWTMEEVLNQGKILVVALPSGSIGSPAADLLGALVVQMVWDTAMRRTELPPDERRPVSLYVDEATRFLRSGIDLGDMLARARGHGLEVIAAAQHLGQASSQLRSALLSEARTKVAFQSGPQDATTLAEAFGPLVHRDDFLTLERHAALCVIAHGGRVSAPVTIQTHARPESTGWGPTALIASAASYGRTVPTIQKEIEERQRAHAAHPERPRALEH